jgi:hypothetical protein
MNVFLLSMLVTGAKIFRSFDVVNESTVPMMTILAFFKNQTYFCNPSKKQKIVYLDIARETTRFENA